MQDRDLRRAAARRAALIIGGMVLALAAVLCFRWARRGKACGD